eukprot:CAMPEP_0172861030 /NCGR_PEP_ID=MMETSP1075-20121228/72426_1 /TAXON_ID=2916 /ORGANISM="Ceratium fusus, Strain PA161109" /LENGTH=199 /DNA_ID=CAMNT_0013709123 /DNA_START=5 /DNA_END=601 /DNA_ORIENTATION=+
MTVHTTAATFDAELQRLAPDFGKKPTSCHACGCALPSPDAFIFLGPYSEVQSDVIDLMSACPTFLPWYPCSGSFSLVFLAAAPVPLYLGYYLSSIHVPTHLQKAHGNIPSCCHHPHQVVLHVAQQQVKQPARTRVLVPDQELVILLALPSYVGLRDRLSYPRRRPKCTQQGKAELQTGLRNSWALRCQLISVWLDLATL